MSGSPGETISGVSTDSRTLSPGNLFFALRGEKQDGHRHLPEVFQKGAVAAVVDREGLSGPCLIQVEDTLRALGDLAHYWRRRFSLRVVAVTGSNGKTTTKDMTGAILKASYRVHKTEGNFNNLIGLPLTLFRLSEAEPPNLAVLEMGMNRPGEIDRLAEIAEPEIGIITNVARAHLGGLGDLQKVARAKAELLNRLPPQGIAVLNADDPSYPLLKKILRSRLVTFGRKGKEVRLLKSTSLGLQGISFRASLGGRSVSFRMPLVGLQNVSNALAALAVADQLGVPIREMRRALASFQTGSKRMEVIRLKSKGRGIDLVNDTYNANPDSMIAALHSVREVSRTGKKRRRVVAVLGEMLELGDFSRRLHREAGAAAARAGTRLLIAVGDHAGDLVQGAVRAGLSRKSALAFSSLEEALPVLQELLMPGDLVLIKGSRGMRMERVVEALQRGGA